MANTIGVTLLSPLGEILIEQLGELLETLTLWARAISSQALQFVEKVQRPSRKGVGFVLLNKSEAPSTLRGDDMVHSFVKTEVQ